MKNSRSLSVAACVFLSAIFATSSSFAMDTPLLTWEKGKLQNVVLGGGQADNSWTVALESATGERYSLSKSRSNKSGFVVYSFFVPKNLPSGAYRVTTFGKGSPTTIVAAVEIRDQARYEVTRVPTDLIFILAVVIFWITSFSALRKAKYRKLSIQTLTSLKERYLAGQPAQDFIEAIHKFAPLERLKFRVYETLPESMFKTILKSDGAGLQLIFPSLWPLILVSSIISGCALALEQDGPLLIGSSTSSTVALAVLAGLGALDLFSGFIGATFFILLDTASMPNLSISSLIATSTLASLFFLPKLMILFLRLQSEHGVFLKSKKSKIRPIINVAIPGLAIHALFLLNFSLTGLVSKTYRLELLVLIASLVGIFLADFLALYAIKKKEYQLVVEEHDVEFGSAFSIRMAVFGMVLMLGVIYSWTVDMNVAVLLALIASFPVWILHFRPTSQLLKWGARLPRNYLVEVSVVLLTSTLIFLFIGTLPVLVFTSAQVSIAAGFVPVIMHALYVFFSDWEPKRELEISL